MNSRYSGKTRQKYIVFSALWLALFALETAAGASTRKNQAVYFEGTDHELHVYRSQGKEPGKTLMLIGGIQGDEPGGFLSADLYADFSLLKGNLIVVPRANFQSIVLNRRQVNGDMNRKFGKFGDGGKDDYETKVVDILKKLIAESDLLLNLHDGSGFYSEKWEGTDRNPLRCGQSIIADCEIFQPQGKPQPVQLGRMAREVAEKLNLQIRDKKHHFHFNNHNTDKKESPHKEQRLSATYYALYTCGIPAFGIETSKTLPLEEKVRQHNLAINLFMEKMDIRPENPGIRLDPPELYYLIISVNDSLPVLVENKQSLHIKPGDAIAVTHIAANYERGLCADILGQGTINDTRKRIAIQQPTRIVVRKDYQPCGSIELLLGGADSQFSQGVPVAGNSSKAKADYLFFTVKINGEERTFRNEDNVKLVKGDTIEIEEVVSNLASSSEFTVNFKGFVGAKESNAGEDRGYLINTAKDLWPRYSMDKSGKKYQVVVNLHKNKVASLWVELEEPALDYVVLKTENNAMQCIAPGGTAWIDAKQPIRLMDIKTNVDGNDRISALFAGPGEIKQMLKKDDIIPLGGAGRHFPKGEYRMDILRDQITIGSVYFKNISGDAS